MENKNKLKLFIPLLGVFVLALAVGFSFAYIRKSNTQEGTNQGATLTCLDTTMTDVTASISLSDEYAITNAEGMEKTPYTFSVTNNCTTPVKVNINVENLTTSTLGANYIRASINDPGNTTDNSSVITSLPSGIAANGGTAYKMQTIILSANETRSLDFRMWIDSNATISEMNKVFNTKLVMDYEPYTYPKLSRLILGTSNANVTAPQTTPGKVISTSTEAVLASTPDDYGTSYYYRGAVENNYVSFANMCWRVVRVTGNGAIKLVLYNYNPNNVSNPCDSTQDGTTNAFARYSGDTYTTAFNANYNQNAYIGFMYGTAGSSSYAAEHANNNKSTILTNLETWYNAKLSSYSSKLADTIWCNDKSTKSTYTVDGTAYGNGLGYSTNQTMYGARDRIYANNKYATGASPTLICANDNNGGKLSKFTADDVAYGNGALTYKIGLLTADEVAFAGGIYGNANSTYYLNKNASGNHWWSLSPGYFIGSYAYGWSVSSTGNLSDVNVVLTYGLRPAVSLSSATTATGSGTQTDPWKIQ